MDSFPRNQPDIMFLRSFYRGEWTDAAPRILERTPYDNEKLSPSLLQSLQKTVALYSYPSRTIRIIVTP